MAKNKPKSIADQFANEFMAAIAKNSYNSRLVEASAPYPDDIEAKEDPNIAFNRPDSKKKAPKFGDKAAIEAEREAGDAAWIAAAELQRLINLLPEQLSKRFSKHLDTITVALQTELSVYKKQEEKKANKGNKNAAKYSSETIKQAVAKFNATKATLSKSARAEIVIKALPDPKPTAKSILNWVKKHS